MNKWDFRRLRVRHLAVIAAVILGGGFPHYLIDNYLFGPSERVSALLSSRFAFSPDTITACTMATYCLLLALALFAGERFLRRFLPRQ